MKRIVACLLVLVTSVAAGAGVTASQAVDCQDVVAYFERMDTLVADGYAGLFEDPDFADRFESAGRNAETSDTGFLALSPEEQEAIIELLSVPGDALVLMDDDDIPEAVRDLHDSAADFWGQLPGMFRTILNDSIFAAMAYAEEMESASIENYEAQQVVIAACPDEVDAYAGKSESTNASFDVFGDEVFTAWGDFAPEDVEGIGYELLFFATEEDVLDATPVASASRIDRVAA